MSAQVTEQPAPTTEQARTPLVKLTGVKKYFPITRGIIFQRKVGNVHAVDGVDLDIYPGGAGARQTRRHMQMIFQAPFASLTPRRTVGSIISEPFRLHKTVEKGKIKS